VTKPNVRETRKFGLVFEHLSHLIVYMLDLTAVYIGCWLVLFMALAVTVYYVILGFFIIKLSSVPKGDMLLVMGDFNAKVGRREPSAMSWLRRNK